MEGDLVEAEALVLERRLQLLLLQTRLVDAFFKESVAMRSAVFAHTITVEDVYPLRSEIEGC